MRIRRKISFHPELHPVTVVFLGPWPHCYVKNHLYILSGYDYTNEEYSLIAIKHNSLRLLMLKEVFFFPETIFPITWLENAFCSQFSIETQKLKI